MPKQRVVLDWPRTLRTRTVTTYSHMPLASEAGCNVTLRQTIGRSICGADTYGCTGWGATAKVWVRSGCRGAFYCNGVRIGICGEKNGTSSSTCSCTPICLREGWGITNDAEQLHKWTNLRADAPPPPPPVPLSLWSVRAQKDQAGVARPSLLLLQYWQGDRATMRKKGEGLLQRNVEWCRDNQPCLHRLVVASSRNASMPATWAKIFVAQQALPEADVLVYLDLDACIIRNPVQFMHPDAAMMAASDPAVQGWTSKFNSGVFAVRNSARGRWLLRAWTMLYEFSSWRRHGLHADRWLEASGWQCTGSRIACAYGISLAFEQTAFAVFLLCEQDVQMVPWYYLQSPYLDSRALSQHVPGRFLTRFTKNATSYPQSVCHREGASSPISSEHIPPAPAPVQQHGREHEHIRERTGSRGVAANALLESAATPMDAATGPPPETLQWTLERLSSERLAPYTARTAAPTVRAASDDTELLTPTERAA